jgi:hypothetical protein
VSLASGTNFTVAASGVYNVQTSIQLANYDNASQDVDIWLRKNGTDIANSNSRVGLAARKAVGNPYHTVFTVNFLVSMNAGDYVQLVWSTSNVNAYIEAYAAGVTQTRPAVPSVITTLTFVSALT